MFKKFLLLPTCLILTGCFSGGLEVSEQLSPSGWTAKNNAVAHTANAESLRGWWKQFSDPALNDLIDQALINSPDRLIARAKIEEARGMRRSSRSFLLPQIGASATTGYEDTDIAGASSDSFYDAKFDASFEIDIFGEQLQTHIDRIMPRNKYFVLVLFLFFRSFIRVEKIRIRNHFSQ